MCWSFFKKLYSKHTHKYIYKHTNNFEMIGKLDKNFDDMSCLDLRGILVWVCDTNLILIHGTPDPKNNITLRKYIGKNIYDVEPKDFGTFCGNLHKNCQRTKVKKTMNILLNDKLVYVVVEPITYNDSIIASILIIIPYVSTITIPS